MTGGEHMAQVLRATGIYELPGDGPADWELAAFGAGFELVEEAMDGLEQGMFALTAPTEWLEGWEKLFRSQPGGNNLAARQKAVAGALGLRYQRPTLEAIQKNVLPAAGIDGRAAMDGGTLKITGSLQGVTEAEARRLLDRLLPAHLAWELELAA